MIMATSKKTKSNSNSAELELNPLIQVFTDESNETNEFEKSNQLVYSYEGSRTVPGFIPPELEQKAVVNDIPKFVPEQKATLGVYKLNPNAILPKYATAGSRCFDICACIDENTEIDVFSPHNVNFKIKPTIHRGQNKYGIFVEPFHRVMVPTGLIFDIPKEYSILFYPRSGLSLKFGITLVNSIGVVDSDYVEQSYILIINNSDISFRINHGDKICQAELVFNSPRIEFEEISERPMQKTERVGGFGSTGV